MSKPSEKRGKLTRPWVFFALPMAVLAAGLAWYSREDWNHTESRLREMLEESADTLARALGQYAQYGLQTYDALRDESVRRLIADARLVAKMDLETRVDSRRLSALADAMEVLQIDLFDGAGHLELSSRGFSGENGGEERGGIVTQEDLDPVMEGAVTSLVVGDDDTVPGRGKRLAAVYARKGGGAVVVTGSGEILNRSLRQSGLGAIMGRLCQGRIAYLILQDRESPISVTPGVGAVAPLDRDPEVKAVLDGGEQRSRFTTTNGTEVLEGIIPLELSDGYPAVFRVGMKLDFYRSTLADLAGRNLLVGIVFLAGTGTLLGVVFLVQHVRFLRSKHMQALALSDRSMAVMDDPLLLVEPGGRVIRANAKAESSFGLKEGDALTPDMRSLLPCVSGAAGRDEEARGGRRTRPGEPPQGMQDDVFSHGQRTFLIHRQPFSQNPGAGEQRACLIVLRDVTEIRALEERLERETRLAGLGRVVSAAAHEIRNPLNAISLSIQTMARKLPPALEGEEFGAGRMLCVIREEIRRLDRIVEDLLVYGRPMHLNRLNLSPAAALERAREILSSETSHAQVSISTESDGGAEGVEVSGDLDKLNQVLLNVFRNSLEASGVGGRITSRLSRSGGAVRLEITDSGPGFSPEALVHASEPFFTTKRKGLGLGLGLSLSAEIVRAHGWEILFSNAPEGGARVTIDMGPAASTHRGEAG